MSHHPVEIRFGWTSGPRGDPTKCWTNFATTVVAVLTSLLIAGPAVSSDNNVEAGIADVIEQVRSDCGSFESGKLTVTDKAVTRIDLTGDGREDAIVDTGGLQCSSAASLYCGTGGCSLFLVTEGGTTDILAKGWKVVDWQGDRVLLLAIHGANCGGSNLRRCYRAMIWSEDAWRSAGD